jgi:multicomponent Na+:H+ antiporter subunit E
MALIWIGFNGGDGSSWVVGGPLVLASAWLSVRLLPAVPWHWSIGGAVSFAMYFLRESWRGGWEVARHAMARHHVITPGLIPYAFHLPPGPARWFFCNTISLLPGTAVVAIEGDRLWAHALNRSPRSAEELRDLERRTAALFGLAWIERRETSP